MLKDYLYNHLLDEKDIILSLLDIDNNICHTNLKYEDLIEMFSKLEILKNINTSNNFICNGEIFVVLEILINYAPLIINLYIDRRFVAINSWLVKRCLNYYNDLGYQLDINLDTSDNFLKYINLPNNIVLGDQTFIKSMKQELKNFTLDNIEIK